MKKKKIWKWIIFCMKKIQETHFKVLLRLHFPGFSLIFLNKPRKYFPQILKCSIPPSHLKTITASYCMSSTNGRKNGIWEWTTNYMKLTKLWVKVAYFYKVIAEVRYSTWCQIGHCRITHKVLISFKKKSPGFLKLN